MAERERVHPDCVNASNPFHRCVEECYIKIATSKARKSKSFSGHNVGTAGYQSPRRKTNRGSSFNNKPVVALEKATVHTVPKASARSSPSKSTSPKSEMESTNPVSSSVAFSGEIRDEDFSFNKGLLGTSRFTITSGDATPALVLSPGRPVKALSSSVTEITLSKPPKETESNNQRHTPPEVVSSIPVNGAEKGTQHRGLHDHSLSSRISDPERWSEDGYEEEVHSAALDSRVSVGKYRVKRSVSSTLRAIFDNFGDIAESCRMESIAMRSYCLECVCLMVQDLRSSSATHLTESKLREMSAILKDLESSQIKVDWLGQALERLSKSGELITQRDAIKVEKAKCDRVLETTKKKLERQLEDLAEKERAVTDAKARVAETEDRLHQIKLESSKLEESIASLPSQIESHRFSSLLDELVFPKQRP